jgi:hypothetical protein
MIADDTTAHYLPERKTVHRGRDGASGHWEPWMEHRAERLYRMRALDRRTHRGPTGEVLRLFLFFADGWGWQYVRTTCIKGYQVNVRGSTRGVANRVRGEELTLENLWKYADDIAEDQYRPELPNQAQIDRVKMTVGLMLFGAVPDGKMGTMERFINDLVPDADPNEMRSFKQVAPLMWSLLNLAEPDALKLLEQDISDEIIRLALRNFRGFMWRMRYFFRKKFFMGKERPPSTNLLTFFGAAKQFRVQDAYRRAPIRVTPAQVLGGQFAHALIIAYNEHEIDAVYEFSMKWFAFWLQSEQCAQWLKQAEHELIEHKN